MLPRFFSNKKEVPTSIWEQREFLSFLRSELFCKILVLYLNVPLFTPRVISNCILVPALAVCFWLVTMSMYFWFKCLLTVVNYCHHYLPEIFLFGFRITHAFFSVSWVLYGYIYLKLVCTCFAGLSFDDLIFGCNLSPPTPSQLPFSCRAGLAINHLMQLSFWQGPKDLMLNLDSSWGLYSYECICFRNLPKWI